METDLSGVAMAKTEAPPPAQKRGFPLVRAALGLVLAAGALALVFWPRSDEQLAVAWRVEPASPAPGSGGVLMIAIKPGPDAPEGSRLVCNEKSRPSVAVTAPADIVFRSRVGFLHGPDDEVPLEFTVKQGAPPGEREITVSVAAELAVEGETVTRPARLRRSITITIGPPRTGESGTGTPRPGPPAQPPPKGAGPHKKEAADYFGITHNALAGMRKEERSRFVNEGVSKAVGDFARIWKDPNPIRGYSWNVQGEVGKLGARLRFLREHDDQAAIIREHLKRTLINQRLSGELRDVFYSLLVEISPASELAFFRNEAKTSKDKWLRSRAILYLATKRDVYALVVGARELSSNQDVEAQLASLSVIRAYFGPGTTSKVPSKYWSELYQDHPSKQRVSLLVRDVRAWWKRNHSDYEKLLKEK